MSIKLISTPLGDRYRVQVEVRSKLDPRIRVQKQDSSSKTNKAAVFLEKRLLCDAAKELNQREEEGGSWGSVVQGWEEYCRKSFDQKTSTLTDNVRVLDLYAGHWAKIPASRINSNDVEEAFGKMLEQGLSYSRIKALRSAINLVFRWAQRSKLILPSMPLPTLGVHIGRPKDQLLDEVLSGEQLSRLLESAKALKHPWFFVWFAAANTGMRSGELIALEWDDIDFEAKLITVSKSYNGRLKLIKSTKSGMWRKIPINHQLKIVLTELRTAHPESVNVLPQLSQWRRGEAAKVLREFCVGIGIPSIRFHTLRACFATQLLQSGVPSPTVKKICGWTDEKVMNRYIRLAGIDIRGATENLQFLCPETAIQNVVSISGYR